VQAARRRGLGIYASGSYILYRVPRVL